MQARKVRFIGFTGHNDPHIHLHMIAVARQHGFHFDAVGPMEKRALERTSENSG